jgi:hypothetical protein
MNYKIQLKFKNMNPKIKSNNVLGSIRTASPWWPLSNSKWFSNYNLDSCLEIDLAETKIEHFRFGGND